MMLCTLTLFSLVATVVLSQPFQGFELRIDAGSDVPSVDSNNKTWEKDGYYTGGQTFKSCPMAIAGTVDDFIYCSERWGDFKYDISVPIGKTFLVTVHFAEIYFQSPLQRVFGVTVNSKGFDGVDLVALAGSKTAYTAVEAAVTPSDGSIEISFHRIVQNPKLSGIEIVEVELAPTVSEPPTPSPSTGSGNQDFDLRINCGSFSSQTDVNGDEWVADVPYVQGGGVYASCGLPISGGENFLYCTERYGTPLYNIAVPHPGSYKVALHFAEIFYNDDRRVFSVQVNDQSVLNIDIVSEVGPRASYIVEVFLADVTNVISISTLRVRENPKIAGIHIMELGAGFVPPTAAPTSYTGTVARINCGGSEYVDSLGRVWAADYGSIGGSSYAVNNAIANTDDDTIYKSERWGQFEYNLPVENGNYDIKLYFTELFFTASSKRLFDVIIEGVRTFTNVDVFQLAGNQTFVAIQLTLDAVSVSDRLLTIAFANASPRVNNPKLSAIEVVESGVGPTPGASPVPTTAPSPQPTGIVNDQALNLNGNWEIFENQAIAARHEACFVMAGNKAYLIGGRETRDVDIFDPELRTWSKGAEAPQLLHHMQCVSVNGKIYLPAAWTAFYPREQNVDVMWVYDTNASDPANAWSSLTAMPESRRRGSTAVVVQDTKIWVSHGNRGGHEQDNFATSLGWIDYYDTATDTWVLGNEAGFPDAPNPRDHTGGSLVNGRICVSGGRDGGLDGWPAVAPTDCFDPATMTWSVEADIPVTRSGASYGTSCDGKLIVAGGERDLSSRVDVFDGQDWQTFTNGLIDSRHGTGLAVDCTRDMIYIASGSPNGGGGKTTSVEIYS